MNLYDEDPVRDAEQAAQAFADYEQRRQAREREAQRLVTELRKSLVAVAACRLESDVFRPGERDAASDAEQRLIQAADDLIQAANQLDGLIVAQALYEVIWHGGPSCDDEAHAQLLSLRDLRDVSELEGR